MCVCAHTNIFVYGRRRLLFNRPLKLALSPRLLKIIKSTLISGEGVPSMMLLQTY